ncbi:diguanylate cyclase domain-containing protein [Rhizosaccharibacter radicis]|uniref:diguanylate cyclase n=1 Tax=Rhizosaccharibacter radicis TaxID=2782605 RepID=A0ABT1VWR6_9PROT|nr:GGDEF domain-containing protein [Acetobacteraceae bacterium KSS12]
MILDSLTLIVAVLLVTMTTCVTCLLSWRDAPGDRLPLLFGAAFGGQTAGLGLQLGRQVLPPVFTVDLSNAGMLLCSGLLWSGHRRAFGRPVLWPAVAAAPVVWLLLCRWPAFAGDVTARIVAMSLLVGVMFLLAAAELWRDRRERLSARRWMFQASLAAGIFMLARGLATPFLPPVDPALVLQTVSFKLTILASLVFFVLHGFGVMTLIRERSEVRLRMDAERDSLTNLPNRRRFDLVLGASAERGAALLMVDVDHFKRFNDLHGHPAGDRCLRAVASVLKSVLPYPPAIAARWGGEEFAVLLPGGRLPSALAVAEAIHRALRAGGASPSLGGVTVSIGVAALDGPWESDGAARLLEAADRALYRAKREGRDGTAVEPFETVASRPLASRSHVVFRENAL